MSGGDADTLDELYLMTIARHIRDDDFLHIGASQLDVWQAAEVAKQLWAPRVRMAAAGVYHLRGGNDGDLSILQAHTYGRDIVARREATLSQSFFFNDLSDGRTAFPGAMQVDALGNGNLIGINVGGKYIRGPGSGGLTSLTSYTSRFFFTLRRHSANILVPRVDRISVLGDPVARRRFGYVPDALKEVITPLASFRPEDDGLRLVAISPGVTTEEVARNTGFALKLSPDFAERAAITTEERKTLDYVRNQMGGNKSYEG